MRDNVFLSLGSRFRPLVLGISLLALTGCAATKNALFSSVGEKKVDRYRFSVTEGDDVLGGLAVVRVEEGDTLADLARHFSVGLDAVTAANPGVDVWVPEYGERILLPLSFILPDAPRTGIVVNLATMRLFHFKEEGDDLAVSTYPVGIGTRERPTPAGQMQVVRKASRPTWYVPPSIAEDHWRKGDPLPAKVPPGPENPLGEYALYLSASGYLIHGTNKPASIGLKATNGCLRLYPENIERLYRDTPVNTPVLIVNQPYLLGQRDGVLYLEAHRPLEGWDFTALESLNAKLKGWEEKSSRPLDWNKVREIQAEALGIPVPILEMRKGAKTWAAKPLKLDHPGAAMVGRPEIPPLEMNAWYVFAGEMAEETNARRIAAIINHQGPPIPARVLRNSTESTGYRVLAGPFGDGVAANKAVKRLKMDLGIDGLVIEPDGESIQPLVTEGGETMGKNFLENFNVTLNEKEK